MQADSSSAAGEPTTFVLAFCSGDNAHLAGEHLERLAFRAVVTCSADRWEVEAGALTAPDNAHLALDAARMVADRYSGRVDHVRGGWRAAELEQVRRVASLADEVEQTELDSLWSHLIETSTNLDPSPLTRLCAAWAAELETTFDWQPPLNGWVTIEIGSEDEH